MNLLQKLFNDRRVREKWDAGVVWFRLRYLDADGPTKCINLLSRPHACGRVALYHCPGEISRLYLGVPEAHVRLLQRMVTDFDFSLKPKSAEDDMPIAQRMTAVSGLPWDKPFLAHIVNEQLFVSLVGAEDEHNRLGSYLPEKKICVATQWHLPDEPLQGLTVQPSWNGRQPPAQLIANKPNPQYWLLGRSQSGIPLHVAGRINIYGRQEAVSDWLVHQVTQMLSFNQDNLVVDNLVVIDGIGDLVPQLKRKAVVTQLLGKRLAYIDIDSASMADGFNPLAVVLGESEVETIHRWQCWFQGMNVNPQGIQLLPQAWKEGVADIPSLRKWLKKVERQGQQTAVSSLSTAIKKLISHSQIRQWIEWPTNRHNSLQEKALLFSCQAKSWAAQHFLHALLLNVSSVKGVCLIVHGYPWQTDQQLSETLPQQLLISNGPLLPNAHPLLVRNSAPASEILSTRFFNADALQTENLQLLQDGEGVFVYNGKAIFTQWK